MCAGPSWPGKSNLWPSYHYKRVVWCLGKPRSPQAGQLRILLLGERTKTQKGAKRDGGRERALVLGAETPTWGRFCEQRHKRYRCKPGVPEHNLEIRMDGMNTLLLGQASEVANHISLSHPLLKQKTIFKWPGMRVQVSEVQRVEAQIQKYNTLNTPPEITKSHSGHVCNRFNFLFCLLSSHTAASNAD